MSKTVKILDLEGLKEKLYNSNNLNLNGFKNLNTFYTPEWAEVLTDTYHYTPVYFILTDDNVVKAFVPLMEVNSPITGKRGISLPFTDFCEPHAVSARDFRELFTAICEYGEKRKWKSVELRGGDAFLKNERPLITYMEHSLDLTRSITDIQKSLRNSLWRNIKKAQKMNIRVECSNSREALDAFVRLNILTRRRHGLPCQPKEFFDNIYRLLISPGQGFVFNAKFDKKVIASSVFFIYNNSVIYKYGASDFNYQHLRANGLVMWEAIQFFKEMNASGFSFGKTHPDNNGLQQFKKGFTNTINTIQYYKYDLHTRNFISDNSPQHSFVNEVFKRMPLFVIQLAGKLLYKHFA